MNAGNDGTNCHINNAQADGSGNFSMNAQPNSLVVAGLRMDSLMSLHPLLLQQEMHRRQEMERTRTPAAASELRIPSDAELEILSRRENELIRLRDAHSQMMRAELVARSDGNAISASGIDDSFRVESIERIIALQEQRRLQAELMMGLPGCQLGQWASNMIQQQNQSLPLGTAQQWHPSSFEYGCVYTNRSNLKPNAMVHGQGRQTASVGLGLFNEKPSTNEEKNKPQDQRLIRAAAVDQGRSNFLPQLHLFSHFSRHTPQQQRDVERLMSLQKFSDGQLMLMAPQSSGSESITMNVIGGFNVTSNGSSLSAPDTLQGCSITTANSVQDRLRYFNNRTEVDVNGNPVKSQNFKSTKPFTHLPGDANADEFERDNEMMSQFVQLVLSRVPEMSHIMAAFLSSLDMRRQAGARCPLRQDVLCVIDMALTELTSIDEHVLQSIDPKCSDFSSRVIQCVAAIEAFKRNLLGAASTSNPLAARIDQSKINVKKCSHKKTTDQKEDDLTLMQMYKRSKRSKNAKNFAGKTVESRRKRSDDKVDNEGVKKQGQSELITKHSFDVNISRPPKKQRLKEHGSSSSSSNPAQENIIVESRKGPHGELLGKLFSTDQPSSTECATENFATETPNNVEKPPNSSNGPLTTDTALDIATESVDTEISSRAAGETDDSKLSAASVLLNLGR